MSYDVVRKKTGVLDFIKVGRYSKNLKLFLTQVVGMYSTIDYAEKGSKAPKNIITCPTPTGCHNDPGSPENSFTARPLEQKRKRRITVIFNLPP